MDEWMNEWMDGLTAPYAVISESFLGNDELSLSHPGRRPQQALMKTLCVKAAMKMFN